MQIIRDIAALRHAISAMRQGGKTIALVPTMGALHEGHMSLVKKAKTLADHVVVSIFVNPTQFGPNEDFDAYPRDEQKDGAMLAEAAVSILWAPDVSVMYPPGHVTHVEVAELGADFCGAARPGHFDGVATVVSKLLNQVRPDIAIFGEKDWQQLAIIRQFVRDLDFPVDIIGAPIARAADGLALSSRNAYLTPQQRSDAVHLSEALNRAAQAIAAGENVASVLAKAEQAIIAGGFDSVDYLALTNKDTLARLDQYSGPARLLAAARMGKTRLLDNLAVG
ncbi:pantoate--beta-alanine ligase [Sphingopyxis yananensis]|uniref:pantoate--beta-alanine ligase n=1 Tax=Sphingopyxis yananensis TaxID=2886687 RepID=UPI001D111CA4|nr:pantoate--beta-alanine ligase [Sphingopyxis yananensis]MCC2601320.1 pantoate--beta-alanine ligase [Sphingopyxis yananensis]